ncbi:hypothetical protein PV10_07550 [Exophiala mesophila]|uniref:Uncharacterized protein n=1 Tax=Exophiala mesophila TaxID=212818 RepID=A0A0D1XQ35_EXOME|nr:uncharacterized protein PV10_07550 [Exophiala mesophila]KIV90221.1 hypothetical protein PV10_07550 [Exophiala mesophila]
MEEIPIFRASKRRKHNKVHDDSTAEIEVDHQPITISEPDRLITEGELPQNDTQDEDHDDESLNAAAGGGGVIRARKQFRRPVTGVSFSNSRASERDERNSSLVKISSSDEAKNRPVEITDRFISSTGQVVDVDEHMVAYIDSELAKRRIGHGNDPSSSSSLSLLPSSQPQIQPNESTLPTNSNTNPSASGSSTRPPSSIPSMQIRPSVTQLSEVDLGTSTYETNLVRTKEALERARLGLPPLSTDPKPPRPRKPRIGRDGKPMKQPRAPRKRRDSESLARDALVESLLHENRMGVGIYEGSPGVTNLDHNASGKSRGARSDANIEQAATNQNDHGQNDADADADADEALAERFRQEFMDAMAERQSRHKSSNQAKHSGNATGATGAGATESKGPKLGGSRAARAKMAQLQQQQQQQKLQGGASSSMKK